MGAFDYPVDCAGCGEPRTNSTLRHQYVQAPLGWTVVKTCGGVCEDIAVQKVGGGRRFTPASPKLART